MDAKLNDEFYSILDCLAKLDTYEGNSCDEAFQKVFAELIEKTDSLLKKTNEIPLFSFNETSEDLSTESIKFLILPGILGSLHSRRTDDRLKGLETALVYYQDFLGLCESYEIKTGINDESLLSSPQIASLPDNIKPQALVRERKLAQYREEQRLKSEVENKLTYIRTNPDVEEETKRSFFTNLVCMWKMNVDKDIPSLTMEKDFIKNKPTHDANLKVLREKAEKTPPVKPFVIDKETARSKVFGLGYPSVPLGGIPKMPENPKQKLNVTRVDPSDDQERKDDERNAKDDKLEDEMETAEAEEERAQKMRMDEYKDTTRRGDGNRMHRL